MVEVVDALRMYQTYVTKVESAGRRIDPIELQNFARFYRKPLEFFVGD